MTPPPERVEPLRERLRRFRDDDGITRIPTDDLEQMLAERVVEGQPVEIMNPSKNSPSTTEAPMKQAGDKLQALKEADDLLARLLSPYALGWNPLLRRNIKRVRKQIRVALSEDAGQRSCTCGNPTSSAHHRQPPLPCFVDADQGDQK